nr:hypothetical protein [Candidatus Sigynarchaeota archaeon]
KDKRILIKLPDIGEEKVIDISKDLPLPYSNNRDYLVSAINVLAENRIIVDKGFTVEVNGKLPIAAGASSSSAMVVAWVNLLQSIFSEAEIKSFQIARWANEAEVKAFGESGGYMDHATSAVGGILFVKNEFSVEKIDIPEDFCIVLGDSLEKKETVENIKKLRASVEEQVNQVIEHKKNFRINNRIFSMDDFIGQNETDGLKLKEHFPLVYANLKNASLTFKALDILKFQKKQLQKVGDMINEHHQYLRDYLGISTPKIEGLISAALKAGALGAKINGSGFGGTMFALCKNAKNQEKVAKEIEKAGGKAYPVMVSNGMCIYDELGNKA